MNDYFDEQEVDDLERLAELSLASGDQKTALEAMRRIDSIVSGVEKNLSKKQANSAEKVAPVQNQDVPAPINEKSIAERFGDAALEGASAVNRGVAKAADFFLTTPFNAMSEAASSGRYKLPTIESMLSPATTGNFMEEGLSKDVIRKSGEVIPGAILAGGVARQAAGLVPQFSASSNAAAPLARQSLLSGSVKSIGSSTLGQDAAFGALSGSGAAIGGEFGEFVGGGQGRNVGEVAGSIITPIAVGSIAPIARSAAKNMASPDKAMIREATPTIEQLKQGARSIYKEIDNLGATVKKDNIQSLSSDLSATMRTEGFNRRIHPKVAAALQEFNAAAKSNQPLSNIDTLRRVSGAAASSTEPDEARLGKILTNKIDNFLDDLVDDALVGGNAENVGEKYRQARQLWQRSRKAEDIDYLIERAKNQATGEENGLRIQFRSLLNNKNKIKSYTPDEVEAMKKVVHGGGVENTLKLLGKFGFSEGQAVRMLVPSLGAAGGAAVGGGVGAVAVPIIGQVSRNLAQKMTRNNSEMVSQIVRAGRNGDAITRAYLAAVPKGQRSAYELSELLISSKASMPTAKTKNEDINKLISESAILINALNQADTEENKNE